MSPALIGLTAARIEHVAALDGSRGPDQQYWAREQRQGRVQQEEHILRVVSEERERQRQETRTREWV